ncbi:ABC transporter [Streptococcus pneumoniae]|nr:ABC transporter [Streptococcus pneumoniae]
MLKLIIYQFQYSKRQWLGTIPLLFVSSLIVGTSLFGIASSIKTAHSINFIEYFYSPNNCRDRGLLLFKSNT